MAKISLQQQTLSFLHTHSVLALATTGPRGLWSAALFFVNDGFTLYFLSSPRSRHAINLSRHSGVSATIQEDQREWRKIQGVQLEGHASRIGGAEQAAAMGRYGLKFPIVANLAAAPVEIAAAMSRIGWFKIVPRRLFFIDNSLGLGHREEVPLQLLGRAGAASTPQNR
jgi:uncharacterized protein YhbP (UPF0306 family)